MKIQSKPRFFRTVRRKNRGVTLIEVVSALGIIAIGLVGLLALFPVAIRESARASDRTTAAILGEYVVEQVRLQQQEIDAGDGTVAALGKLGWGDYTYNDKTHTFNASGSALYGSGEYIVNGAEDDETLYARYEVTLDFENADGFSSGGLKQVIVTIRWPRATTSDERDRQNTMTFVTFIRPSF